MLNFSEWQRSYEEAPESSEVVLGGEMPPRSYTAIHPLSTEERAELARGLATTLGTSDRGRD